jgi:trk system potassium uptake protein TrkH
LSGIGQWTTILAMFIGRVGPLTFAAALARESSGGDFRYAYEDVMVG